MGFFCKTSQGALCQVCSSTADFFSYLVYRKDCRGRALAENLQDLGLKKYDRPLPTKVLPDVALFEHLSVPFKVVFWRMTKRDRVVHDCPLLTDIPGDLYDAWVVDGLHGWALGGLGCYVAWVFQFILKVQIFTPSSEHIDSEQRDRLALLHVKALLQTHYNKLKQDGSRGPTHTQAG